MGASPSISFSMIRRTPTSTACPSPVLVPPDPALKPSPIAPIASPTRNIVASPSPVGDYLDISDELRGIIDSFGACPLGRCQGARFGLETSEEIVVPIVLPSGETIGTIRIPPGVIRAPPISIDLSYVLGVLPSTFGTGSILIDLTLMDSYGFPLTRLMDDIEICVKQPNVDRDEACLGYFDLDRQQWICEDPCLKRSGDAVCGSTGHLTSFAILLGGGPGNNDHDPCSDNSFNEIIPWLSLGFICLAVILVITAAVGLEVMMCIRRRRRKSFTESLERDL